VTAAETMPSAASRSANGNAPSPWFLLVLFWAVFAVAVTTGGIIDPALFAARDPDSLMRLAGVRDLLAGQAWFDLTQHRMDPPDGALMHWSRLIDAPIAALILLGDVLGLGEPFALTLWPLLLLAGLMAGVMLSASALGGRAAVTPALALTLLFLDPLLLYLPNDIDHHNAQIALLVLTLAAALRLPASPKMGAVVGLLSALTLAIGLEMLPYVALMGAAVALQWVLGGDPRGASLFGASFAAGLVLLYAVTASPEARFACDSLSVSYVMPAVSAGIGLAVLALFLDGNGSRALRLVGAFALGASALAAFLLVAPDCLAGPYGTLSAELTSLWLDGIVEAQPLATYFIGYPVGAIGTLAPPLLALAIAARRLWSDQQADRCCGR
jgi:hypothetical protein